MNNTRKLLALILALVLSLSLLVAGCGGDQKPAAPKAEAPKTQKLKIALVLPSTVDDMDIPGFRLHPLKGDMQGRWAITVSGNWRVTFEFRDGNAHVLDYEDYH